LGENRVRASEQDMEEAPQCKGCGADDWSISERRDLDTDVVAQRRKDAASHFRSHWREKRFTRLREFTSNQDHLRIECMDD